MKREVIGSLFVISIFFLCFYSCKSKEELIHTLPMYNTLAFGGDVMIARWAHLKAEKHGYRWFFEDIKDLLEADITLINLECVISSRGKPSFKDERNPYYYRARPEMINILVEGGVDVVTGANNHTGDYGEEAILEEMELLKNAGIEFVGIGKNIEEAKSPKFFKVGDTTIAIIGLDTTQYTSQATSTKPGTFWLSETEPDIIVNEIKEIVEKTKKVADLVFLTVHWGGNFTEKPTPSRRELAKRLIREGKVDGILGHSAHQFHGIEIIDGKPVIYDAGNLLFDYRGEDWVHKSLLFRLHFDKRGVRWIELVPIKLLSSKTVKAPLSIGEEILERIQKLSEEFGTKIIVSGNKGYLLLNTQNSDNATIKKKGYTQRKGLVKVPKANEIKPNVVLDKLPQDVIRVDIEFENGIKLLGYKIPPSSRKRRWGFFVTTYWTATKPLSSSYMIFVHVEPVNNKVGPRWIGDHEPGDWAYPTIYWRPGEIIEDLFFVRSHNEAITGLHTIYYGLFSWKDPSEFRLKVLTPQFNDGENRVPLWQIDITP